MNSFRHTGRVARVREKRAPVCAPAPLSTSDDFSRFGGIARRRIAPGRRDVRDLFLGVSLAHGNAPEAGAFPLSGKTFSGRSREGTTVMV